MQSITVENWHEFDHDFLIDVNALRETPFRGNPNPCIEFTLCTLYYVNIFKEQNVVLVVECSSGETVGAIRLNLPRVGEESGKKDTLDNEGAEGPKREAQPKGSSTALVPKICSLRVTPDQAKVKRPLLVSKLRGIWHMYVFLREHRGICSGILTVCWVLQVLSLAEAPPFALGDVIAELAVLEIFYLRVLP